MESKSFADIGKVEAIASLFVGTGYDPFVQPAFTAALGDRAVNAHRVFLEGVDFDLVYFPLMHLGYKCVIGVTGELYASMAHTRHLDVVLGVSAKLDYEQVAQIWKGMVTAAREHGYKTVSLDLVPSRNGLTISLSASGCVSNITFKRKSAAKSKDLLCVSGSLGAAFLGMQVLEREKARFNDGVSKEDRDKVLGTYRMLVGDYLKPELPSSVVEHLEDDQIYPSCGVFVTRGLADAVKRIQRSTGLGVKVYADKIPFEGNSFQLGRELDMDPVSAAMNGGDDNRLLFTVPILEMEKFRRDFQTFDIIGHLAQADAGTVLVSPDGLEHPVTAQGWPE